MAWLPSRPQSSRGLKNANDFRSEKERGAAPAAPRLFVIGTPFDRLTAPEGTTLAKARVKSGQCAFRIDGELRPSETMFYRRHLLPVGEALAGPAILLQKECRSARSDSVRGAAAGIAVISLITDSSAQIDVRPKIEKRCRNREGGRWLEIQNHCLRRGIKLGDGAQDFATITKDHTDVIYVY